MNAPLARYLTRFDAEALVEVEQPETGVSEPMITLRVAELEARLDEARQSARAAAEAALAEAQEASESAVATAVVAAVAAARAEWCGATADDLAAALERAFGTLRETFGAEIARVLRPLLADAMRERTLALLMAAIDRLLEDPSHPAIMLKGPADMIAALQARHTLTGVGLVETDQLETTITAAGAFVETRLATALADLAAVEV